VRIFTHDFSVLASSRFALVGIDDEVTWGRSFIPPGGIHE